MSRKIVLFTIAFLFIHIFVFCTENKDTDKKYARVKYIKDILVPSGYKRIKLKNKSYSNWIRNLALKKNKHISSYTGSFIEKYYNYKIFYVVQKKLYYKENVEQCADFAMRFWADYHKEKKKLKQLYLFNYSGKKIFFRKKKKIFSDFLFHQMMYSNSYSIKKGAKKVFAKNLLPGDMLVQNKSGNIGHLSIIMDVAESKNKKRIYLIGYSFMPAQEFHIEKAESKYGIDGWYTHAGYLKYLKKNKLSIYGKPVYRRF